MRVPEASVFGLQLAKIPIIALSMLAVLGWIFVIAFWKPKILTEAKDVIVGFWRFFYATFLKPHTGDDSTGQQAALESFYKAQV